MRSDCEVGNMVVVVVVVDGGFVRGVEEIHRCCWEVVATEGCGMVA